MGPCPSRSPAEEARDLDPGALRGDRSRDRGRALARGGAGRDLDGVAGADGMTDFVRAGTVDELREAGMTVVPVGRTPVLVLWDGEAFRALDNRCPHMGFPLHTRRRARTACSTATGTTRASTSPAAQTLDPWADDVDCVPASSIRGRTASSSIPARPERDARAHGLERLAARPRGQRLTLVMFEGGRWSCFDAERRPARGDRPRGGAHFGAARARATAGSSGLSILSAMANVRGRPWTPVDRPRAARPLPAAYDRVATAADQSTAPPAARASKGLGARPRRPSGVVPRDGRGARRGRRRARPREPIVDEHGAEARRSTRCSPSCTDHRYADVGHTLDFAVKCVPSSPRVWRRRARASPCRASSSRRWSHSSCGMQRHGGDVGVAPARSTSLAIDRRGPEPRRGGSMAFARVGDEDLGRRRGGAGRGAGSSDDPGASIAGVARRRRVRRRLAGRPSPTRWWRRPIRRVLHFGTANEFVGLGTRSITR